MKDKETFFNIDKNKTKFLKGIAILFVLLGHMGYIYKGGSWGVSLLLMLSGYGIFKSYISNKNKDYFSKKILKVYIPYLLVTIFILIYSYVKYKIGLKTTVFSLLGIDFGYICDKTMWYISFIFLWYIVFFISTLLFFKIKKEWLQHLLIIILCFIFGYLIYRLSRSYMIWGVGSGAFLYVFSFPIGIFMGKLSYIKINKNIKRFILSVVSFVIILLISLLFNHVDTNFKYFLWVYTMPILLIIIFDLNIIKTDNKIINYIGDMSYDIYLWEGFLLSIRFKLFDAFSSKIFIDILMIVSCIFIAKVYRELFIDQLIGFIGKIIEKLKRFKSSHFDSNNVL